MASLAAGTASRRKPAADAGKRFGYVEPAETCLPPAGADAAAVRSDGARAAVRVATLAAGSFGTTLVGARDIRGRGSHFDEVSHADPFILVHFI